MKIKDLIPVYLKHLQTIGRANKTIKGARYDLKPFLQFLETETVISPEDLTPDVMAEYQQELAFKLTAKGTLLSLRSQAQLLGVAKGFTRFLKQKDYLLLDPGESIQLPRKPRTLPKVILSQPEIKRLINAPDTRTNKGYRNRIILEILYDTAIRRAELCEIKLYDLDLKTGFIHIHGKGSKDRIVPLSSRVCDLIQNYILVVRPVFIKGDDPGYLILNRWGKQMTGNAIWNVVKQCAQLAGIKKNITTHGLRHTCATHMLKNGAPVRHIQEMLGHESLESTQIYTRVTINDLKKIHAKYHPGENF
jgi:integrase/recombinase XerD